MRLIGVGGGGEMDGTAVHFVATRERQQLDERVIMCHLLGGGFSAQPPTTTCGWHTPVGPSSTI